MDAIGVSREFHRGAEPGPTLYMCSSVITTIPICVYPSSYGVSKRDIVAELIHRMQPPSAAPDPMLYNFHFNLDRGLTTLATIEHFCAKSATFSSTISTMDKALIKQNALPSDISEEGALSAYWAEKTIKSSTVYFLCLS